MQRILSAASVVLALLAGASSCSAQDPKTFDYGVQLGRQAPDYHSVNDPANSNNDPSVTAARGVLSDSPVGFVGQLIYGFDGNKNPEPTLGTYQLSSISNRLGIATGAGKTPIVVLYSAPCWMRNLADGCDITKPPTSDHYDDFGDLAVQIATVTGARNFVVWQELRGFFVAGVVGTPAHWDKVAYTDMYNHVYAKLKAYASTAGVTINVGGPYAVMSGNTSPVRSTVSELYKDPTVTDPTTGEAGWGYLDQSMIDLVKYWNANKTGADFIAFDGATRMAKEDNGTLQDPVGAAMLYYAVDNYVKNNLLITLPIYWMESQQDPITTPWSDNKMVAARVAALSLMAASGARVGMQWQPQLQTSITPVWIDKGLWLSAQYACPAPSSPTTNCGGTATDLATLLIGSPLVMNIIQHSPTLTKLQSGAVVIHDSYGYLFVNTANSLQTVTVSGTPVTLSSQQVKACSTLTSC